MYIVYLFENSVYFKMLYRRIRCKILTKAVARFVHRLNKNFVHNVREEIHTSLLLTTMEHAQINSVHDWKSVRRAILEHESNRGYYTKENVDALIVNYCTQAKKYDLGSSYLDFLNKENIKPNLATLGKYLRLLYMKNQKRCLENATVCSEKEAQEILERYEVLRKGYPILDSFTLENSILALSVTSSWKKCLDLLKEVKVSAVPSTAAYSAIISAAFLNEEENLAWNLLKELLEHDKTPTDIIFLSYLRIIRDLKKKENAIKHLEKLFKFFQENNLKCGQEVAVNIGEVGEKFGYRRNYTTVTYKGLCKSCQQKLDNFELSNKEFEELKNKVLENVIVGRDLFVKTNPKELEHFKEFVAGMGKFDVVLDGLNVAYSAGTKQSPVVYSALVASVVSYFIKHEKKVLVLGRVHMNRWPKKYWGYVVQHSGIFLTQNISQDDPYLLYCALNSGKDTIIVTRDLMRGHKFLLKDIRLKILFNRWLSQRQYQLLRVDDDKGPIFRMPPLFSILAQKNQNAWHIPYKTETPKDRNEFHKTWLCLKC